MNIEFLDRFSKKYSNIKFHDNPSSGILLFHADGRTEGQTGGRKDGQTDMTKLIVPFSNFSGAPKMLKS